MSGRVTLDGILQPAAVSLVSVESRLDALEALPHDIANRVIHLNAVEALIEPRTTAVGQSTSGGFSVLEFADGLDHSAFWCFELPDWYDGGSLQATLHWTGDTARVGLDVWWNNSLRAFPAGCDLSGGGNGQGGNSFLTPHATAEIYAIDALSARAVGNMVDTPVAGSMVQFILKRNGVDAVTDTYTGAAWVHGVSIREV